MFLPSQRRQGLLPSAYTLRYPGLPRPAGDAASLLQDLDGVTPVPRLGQGSTHHSPSHLVRDALHLSHALLVLFRGRACSWSPSVCGDGSDSWSMAVGEVQGWPGYLLVAETDGPQRPITVELDVSRVTEGSRALECVGQERRRLLLSRPTTRRWKVRAVGSMCGGFQFHSKPS